MPPLEALATIPLPTSSDVHYAAIDEQNGRIAILSLTGEISVFSLDLSVVQSITEVSEVETTPIRKKGKGNKFKGLPSLKPISTISIVEGKESRQATIIALAFVGSGSDDVDMENVRKNGELVIGRMGGGGRLVWEKAVSE